MKALYLDGIKKLSIRDYSEEKALGNDDVRVAVKKVGICGSDIHYYQHGRIGSFVVEKPMILGHEASGVVTETGANVRTLRLGDPVCMEPGIPDFQSKAAMAGMYNLDPALTFWATPPVHGCLRESVVHPAALTYKLPRTVSPEEGAMVEPLAIGMQTAVKAAIKPGDRALVTGAGTIGIMSALSLLAGGCAEVVITDVNRKKLSLLEDCGGIVPVDVSSADLRAVTREKTGDRGFDIVVEASGFGGLYPEIFSFVSPGGRLVAVGIPEGTVPVDIVEIQKREISIHSVFRYANVYDRAISLMASGKLNVKRFIGKEFTFEQSIEAFEYAAGGGEGEVKVMIGL